MRRPHSQPEVGLPSGSQRRRGFTAVAAALTVLLFAGLIALAIGVIWTSGGGARRATCANQFKELVAALNMYKADHDDYPPGFYSTVDATTGEEETVTWADLISPYLMRTDILCCSGAEPATSSGDGDRSHGALSSYWYPRGVRPPVETPASGAASAPPGRIGVDREEVVRHHVLLVCRSRDSSDPNRRVLVAYENGSVTWERLPHYLTPQKSPPRTPEPGHNDW